VTRDLDDHDPPGTRIVAKRAPALQARPGRTWIFTGPAWPSARSASAPLRISSSLRKRTCVDISGRVAASVPDSPQQRSFSAIGVPISVFTTLSGSWVFIGVWQGSWYM
jgi:hypothetical protein